MMILKNTRNITILTLLFFSVLMSWAQQAKTTEQPNIIIFLCDDLGYGDLSSYGHPFIKTPNIDKLAATGIRMTNYYAAAPVCSPSRVGLLTGRSPNRAGVYDFIPGPKKSEDLRDKVHLQEGEETIPAMLKTVGYETALVGKWHCSSLFNNPAQPQPDYFGFDHWYATHNNASPSHKNPKNFVRNGEKVGQQEGFSCQLVVDEAMSWLDNREGNHPFYLQVTFHEPHEPVASPEDLMKEYLPYSNGLAEAEFFANVANVDKAVGRLLAYLEEKETENTLVIFTSDNGPETFTRYPGAKRTFGQTGGLKGRKLWTTEAGIRVPGIVNWIGKPMYTGTTDAVVSALDFLPTLSELTGAKLPNKELDGESFLSLIKTGKFERKKPLVWGFYNALNQHKVAMRYGDYKILARLKNNGEYLPQIMNVYDGNEALIKESELTDYELYNLIDDKMESVNLVEIEPEKFTKMKKLLHTEYGKLLEGSHIWRNESK
ncbi:sulfatase-like hydrolase/transferase [uncultured Maribacter sp.]|uniref:sulfatase-like hydrolase/transferase n=1 Tax=uncultured Maribacter sp. TaxID=431308 RepID=UPI0030ED5B40|tara:strand:- start:2456 stop:3919 length:1464 start_codon:yes stop_codon:yes gene_type:complete